MTIHLDHTIVPSRHMAASAKKLAELLGVPWGKAVAGPFTAVYVHDGLTLDFNGHQWEMLTASYARQPR